MAQGLLVKRPQRWDETFGRGRIHPDWVNLIVSSAVFADINPEDFPDDLQLADIIANDCSVRWYSRGDVVYSAGSYETSIFVVLNGGVRIADATADAQSARQHTGFHPDAWLGPLLDRMSGRTASNVTQFPRVLLGRYDIFGELEAMTRTARSNTVFVDEDRTALLEISWPGARELLHWSDTFRHRIEKLYRDRSIETGLKESALFSHCDYETLVAIAEQCTLERHGDFDWSHNYQRDNGAGRDNARIIEQEPAIIEQGHYLEDMFLVRSGFARITENTNDSEFTVGFMEPGDVFGLAEIDEGFQSASQPHARHGLRSVGYTDLVRIPEYIVGKFVLSAARLPGSAGTHAPEQIPHGNLSLLDFVVDNRFINATNAMVIDTTRCVGCDDCVRACAAAHDGVARFERTGRSHANLMVANACMHCSDPVCLIDCPTAAIHRDTVSGSVVIDDATCIGCATCSSACPYNNIQMREVRDPYGAILIDDDGSTHLKASKCDLCAGQSSGPACQRACPHDALMRVDIRDINTLSGQQKYV